MTLTTTAPSAPVNYDLRLQSFDLIVTTLNDVASFFPRNEEATSLLAPAKRTASAQSSRPLKANPLVSQAEFLVR